jgi:hypothetical protein
MLIKSYHRAILERQTLRFKSRASRPVRITSRNECVDPENALDALEILSIASRTAGANTGDNRNAHLRLERWAVEAALRRRNFEELSTSDIHLIRQWTHDSVGVKWPRSFLDHA